MPEATYTKETPMTIITVTRTRIARNKMAGPGPGAAWHWRYYATGPDTIRVGGRELPRQFDNSSIADLRRVLKRAYGRDVEIREGWRR